MKAIVMEIGPEHTIALTPQGEYIRLKTLSHYKVGCEVEYTSAPAIKHWARYAFAAAVLIFCIGIGGFIHAYTTPYSYVNLDINPSVEIAVNRFDHIINVKGMNADGDALLFNQSVIYKPLRNGVDILLEKLDQGGYLPADSQSTLVFTIASEDQRKIDHLDEAIGEAINQKLSAQSKVEAYVIHTDMKTHSNAGKYNLSSGRFLLIQELQKTTNQNLNPTVMKDTPIAQIVKMIREKTTELTGSEESSFGQGLLKPIMPQGKQRQQDQNIRQKKERQDNQQRQQERQNIRQQKSQGSQQKQEWQDNQQRQQEGHNIKQQKSQDGLQRQEQQGSRQRQERQNIRQQKRQDVQQKQKSQSNRQRQEP
jgi:hypothetical protein